MLRRITTPAAGIDLTTEGQNVLLVVADKLTGKKTTITLYPTTVQVLASYLEETLEEATGAGIAA